MDVLHQVFLGFELSRVWTYIRAPLAIFASGLDQRPKQTSSQRQTGEWDSRNSPWAEPAVGTEIFVRTKSVTPYPELDAFNDTRRSLTPRIHVFANRLRLERVDANVENRLASRSLPFRPISLGGFAASAGRPSGGGG